MARISNPRDEVLFLYNNKLEMGFIVSKNAFNSKKEYPSNGYSFFE
jgi:hypothetical protein